MIRPSKAVIAGAAVAGLLTGSFAMRAYAASTTSTKAGVAVQTMADAERASTDAKAKTNVKAKAAARPVTMAARLRTPARVKAGAPPNRRILAPYKLKLASLGLPGDRKQPWGGAASMSSGGNPRRNRGRPSPGTGV